LFDGTASPVLYSLSLHDALPISGRHFDDGGLADWNVDSALDEPDAARRRFDFRRHEDVGHVEVHGAAGGEIGLLEMALIVGVAGDRKSTRLNSSHQIISYAVFCL